MKKINKYMKPSTLSTVPALLLLFTSPVTGALAVIRTKEVAYFIAVGMIQLGLALLLLNIITNIRIILRNTKALLYYTKEYDAVCIECEKIVEEESIKEKGEDGYWRETGGSNTKVVGVRTKFKYKVSGIDFYVTVEDYYIKETYAKSGKSYKIYESEDKSAGFFFCPKQAEKAAIIDLIMSSLAPMGILIVGIYILIKL